MGEMSNFQLGVIGALFLSVASSVSIVICNKALMSNLGFPFGDKSFYPFFKIHKILMINTSIVKFISIYIYDPTNLFFKFHLDQPQLLLVGIWWSLFAPFMLLNDWICSCPSPLTWKRSCFLVFWMASPLDFSTWVLALIPLDSTRFYSNILLP